MDDSIPLHSPALPGKRTHRRVRRLHPFSRVEISADSRVTPCCSLWVHGDMGTLTEQTLGEIWNGERFQALRAEMYEGGRPERICNAANSGLCERDRDEGRETPAVSRQGMRAIAAHRRPFRSFAKNFD